eukprot:356443-Chlamydomonas_euryale.AAC.11
MSVTLKEAAQPRDGGTGRRKSSDRWRLGGVVPCSGSGGSGSGGSSSSGNGAVRGGAGRHGAPGQPPHARGGPAAAAAAAATAAASAALATTASFSFNVPAPRADSQQPAADVSAAGLDAHGAAAFPGAFPGVAARRHAAFASGSSALASLQQGVGSAGRTADFWRRAVTIYAGYKVTQGASSQHALH